MLKLERLIYAMAEHEGWEAPKSDKPLAASRSYRQHNPLNLRRSPLALATVGGFSVFNTDADGFNAAKWDIMQKALGNTSTGLNGNSTLAQLISVWAPVQDGNNPSAYVAHVCALTGFAADTKLKEFLP
jgi:hypothetical protein